jgi:DNA-binding CsgD family transcriptional regulator
VTTKATRPIFIYALLDPFTEQIRYIGKSVRPKSRLLNHCNDPAVTWRTNWIKSVMAQGRTPMIQILEKLAHADDWQEVERRWIAYGREQGWPLTNCTDGGDGVPNLPPDIRERMRLTWLGRKHRPESLERIGTASRGRHHTDEHKARMSALMSARTFSAEHRSRISAGLVKLSPSQVGEVHSLIADGVPQREIARRLGVHQGTISNVKRGIYYPKSVEVAR